MCRGLAESTNWNRCAAANGRAIAAAGKLEYVSARIVVAGRLGMHVLDQARRGVEVYAHGAARHGGILTDGHALNGRTPGLFIELRRCKCAAGILKPSTVKLRNGVSIKSAPRAGLD